MASIPLRKAPVEETLAAIKTARLVSRTPATNDPVLDRIHRELILEHDVLTNGMYRLLLEGGLPDAAWRRFFTEYFHGSARGFYREVICKAIRAHESSAWSRYVLQIIHEESTPAVHYEMFAEFLRACGMPAATPDVAPDFNRKMLAGFTRSLPYALGYSLAIEVEADYQIALLALAVAERFERPMLETRWFDVHLDFTGEEAHARICIETIEGMAFDAEQLAELRRGFVQSCDDTRDYMNATAALVRLAAQGG